jgi:DNA-directed RNA polymerase specialized sigma24 family protein
MAGGVGTGVLGTGVRGAGAEAPLLRTAYLLTGDGPAAEDLLADALAGARRWWRRGDDPVGAVRRALVRRVVAGQVPAAETPADPATGPDGGAEELRRALLALPPRVRAALVLRLHDDLTEARTADALGCSPAALAALVEEGRAALCGVLPDRPAPGSPVAPVVPAGDEGAADADAIYRWPQ